MSFVATPGRTTARVIVALAIVSAAFLAVAWRSAVDPIEPPAASGFDPSLIRRGAELAALGDCNTCHTARNGRVFAGGRPIPTPFGTIYSTNITPDPLTGIGRWSEVAFARAMREGVDRRGRHLYPAFPYDHFTLISDGDIEALYAYLMTRQRVHAPAQVNDLPFPLSFRPLLAGWKLLFFREGRYVRDGAHDDAWNRGAYLAEGVAHCGACHTPRNLLGAERANQRFAGGDSENWHAYALDEASQAPVAWDTSALQFYLRNGWHPLHGVARGPMGPVTENMAGVPAADVHAIAAYVASGMGSGPRGVSPPRSVQPDKVSTAQADTADALQPGKAGAAIYAAACASCHESGQPLPFGGIDLSLSIGVSGEEPTNLLHVVLDGLPAVGENARPIMPGFADTLSEPQLLALLTYLRSRFAGKPLWSNTERVMRDVETAERTCDACATGGPQ